MRICKKSLFCNAPNFSKTSFRFSSDCAIIISTNNPILSFALNILSVLQRPIPCAPYCLANFAPSGVSALARIPIFFAFCDQLRTVLKSSVNLGSTVGTAPINTIPVLPSIVITSPSAIVLPFTWHFRAS